MNTWSIVSVNFIFVVVVFLKTIYFDFFILNLMIIYLFSAIRLF